MKPVTNTGFPSSRKCCSFGHGQDHDRMTSWEEKGQCQVERKVNLYEKAEYTEHLNSLGS